MNQGLHFMVVPDFYLQAFEQGRNGSDTFKTKRPQKEQTGGGSPALHL